MERINGKGVPSMGYEPILNDSNFFGAFMTRDLSPFKQEAELEIANQSISDLEGVALKVYTLDPFSRDS